MLVVVADDLETVIEVGASQDLRSLSTEVENDHFGVEGFEPTATLRPFA
jgi:hypothetical protein